MEATSALPYCSFPTVAHGKAHTLSAVCLGSLLKVDIEAVLMLVWSKKH